MGRGGAFRRAAHNQVRLDRHPRVRRKRLHSEQLKVAGNRPLHLRRVVAFRFDQGYLWHDLLLFCRSGSGADGDCRSHPDLGFLGFSARGPEGFFAPRRGALNEPPKAAPLSPPEEGDKKLRRSPSGKSKPTPGRDPATSPLDERKSKSWSSHRRSCARSRRARPPRRRRGRAPRGSLERLFRCRNALRRAG